MFTVLLLACDARWSGWQIVSALFFLPLAFVLMCCVVCFLCVFGVSLWLRRVRGVCVAVVSILHLFVVLLCRVLSCV